MFFSSGQCCIFYFCLLLDLQEVVPRWFRNPKGKNKRTKEVCEGTERWPGQDTEGWDRVHGKLVSFVERL